MYDEVEMLIVEDGGINGFEVSGEMKESVFRVSGVEEYFSEGSEETSVMESVIELQFSRQLTPTGLPRHLCSMFTQSVHQFTTFIFQHFA